MARIYTRKGDDGTTSLLDGKRIKKSEPIIRLLGELDSLNAKIGLACSFLALLKPLEELHFIQQALFDLGACLAAKNRKILSSTRYDENSVSLLEQWIDAMDQTLVPLNTFILPGGHPAAATLHLARCQCRKLESIFVELEVKEGFIFLNRLSDYLFVLARFINQNLKIQELIWKHG